MTSTLEDFNKNLQEANLIHPRLSNYSTKCVACGQPASVGQLCNYCHEMKEELRCWPKSLGHISGIHEK